MYRKDYEKGAFLMLPSHDESGARTTMQTILYSIGMIAFSILPVVMGLSGWIYGSMALLLGAWFMIPVMRFRMTRSVQHARAVLKASVLYIPILLLAIVLDRVIG